jgi:hypothetical protein
VVVEILDHLLVAALGYADFVLSYEVQVALIEFLKLRGGDATHGALLGSVVTFVDITAYGADKFLLHKIWGN